MTDKIAQVDIGKTFDSPFGQSLNITDLVSSIVSNVFVVAGIIILAYFIIGGYGILSGSSGSNPEKAAKGKQAVTSAVIGFIIIFVSYWIVKIIETVTGLTLLG